MRKKWKQWQILLSWAPESPWSVIAAMKLRLAPWKKSYDRPRQYIKKQRHYFADKGLSSQSYDFSRSHVWMWEKLVKVAQLHPILCNPTDYTVHGILQSRILVWVAFPFSRGSSQPKYPSLQVDSLPAEPQAQFSSVQSLSRVRLFATPWITEHQVSLSITNSRSLLKLMSIESVMPSSHFILCRLLVLLPPILPSIRVFSSESTLPIRWPKCWSFSFSISPFEEHPGLSPLEWTGWISLQSKGLSRVFSNTTFQKHQFFGTQLSSQPNSHIHTWPLEKP